jgi:hypothetical protein
MYAPADTTRHTTRTAFILYIVTEGEGERERRERERERDRERDRERERERDVPLDGFTINVLFSFIDPVGSHSAEPPPPPSGEALPGGQ